MKKLLLLLTGTLLLNISFSQLKALKDKVLGGKEGPVNSLFKKPDPITTSFKDVNVEGYLPPDFGTGKNYLPLKNQPRDSIGGFILRPGFYESKNMSYCLKAGTHGPSTGDGYMYAPVKGTMDDVVLSILRNHQNNQQVAQRDVQLLLWAIIAKSSFKDLSTKLKVISGLLLTAEQIYKLNGGALGLIPDNMMQKAMASLPPAVQKVMEAENKIRHLSTQANATYEDFEQYAVLLGVAPNDRPDVESGRWTLHPNGYYIRYFPQGYPTTVVQIYVPPKLNNVIYDAIGTIACPANTNKQRLAQTQMFK